MTLCELGRPEHQLDGVHLTGLLSGETSERGRLVLSTWGVEIMQFVTSGIATFGIAVAKRSCTTMWGISMSGTIWRRIRNTMTSSDHWQSIFRISMPPTPKS
jgi:hypothetical protein